MAALAGDSVQSMGDNGCLERSPAPPVAEVDMLLWNGECFD